jgi:uncharacterized protein (TIGR02145 family)
LKQFLLILFFVLSIIFRGTTQTVTTVGTDFWIAFPPNQNTTSILSIFISSPVATSGNVSSAYPGVNQAFTVTPGTVTQVTVPTGVALAGGIENKGIEVTSNDPIAVYGLNNQAFTADAYLALPVPALGTDYRIVSYFSTLSSYPSELSVVATQDGTVLTIFDHQGDSTFTINLNTGQTYMLIANGLGKDETGSRVQSNHPVGVFGGVRIVDIPNSTCQAGDYIVEMMFPEYSWGKNFVTVPLAGRDNSGDVFRIVAAEDATDISINGTYDTTINAGDHYQVNLTGYNSVSTSKAVTLAQYAKGEYCTGSITGDPFMMLIPPEEQFLTNYTVVNVAGFTTHWVNIAAPDYAVGYIYQDGTLIPAGAFTQIGTTNFYGAQRSVTQGSHTFNSIYPFGVFIYGWNTADSYGYPGGCSLSPVSTISSITLTPDTSYGTLNVTNICLTANVLDMNSNPVPGVLINFHVYGLNPFAGTAYTDASGNAQYCYTQIGSAAGTDHVYADQFGVTSDTVVVIWSYTPPCIDPANGGTIGSDQSGCGTFTPATLTNLGLPSGETGTLEYKWQSSVTGSTSGFSDIPGSNSPSYSPGTVTQTTWYQRLAMVTCMSDWSGAVASNVVQVTVQVPSVVGVTISASANDVCAGTSVTFTANPVNEGSSPSWQWKVNGFNSGTNSPVFTYPPGNGDQVLCILTSSLTCTSNNPATSNSIPMTVNPNLPVSVTVAASQNPVCTGTTVIFTAFPGNEGSSPGYQWKVNGVNGGTNSTLYSYIPVNSDIVSCTLTSSETCTTGNPASAQVQMVVNNILPVSVTISASANPVCSGIPVTFTAVPLNGGTIPSYQWQVNSINVGTNSPTYSYLPVPADQVTCILTSNITCPSGNPATSNTILMTVNANPIVIFTPCNDTITTLNAKPFKLKGGIPLSGTYSGPGVNSVTGIFNPATAGVGTKTITYTYTNVTNCSASKSISILNLPSSIFTCGSTLTDIRDNKTYATVQIGSQCWMAEDLNYGIEIPVTQDQRDNCIPEKYSLHPLPLTTHSFYQWDELMQYDDTPADQGLCPPAWHIPTETDWNTLFANYIDNGFAGSPLKYSGYSGFNALLSGTRHMNKSWDFLGFATFFWSSTLRSSTQAWAHGMNDVDPSVSAYPSSRANAFSVRCLQDNSSMYNLPTITTNTVTCISPANAISGGDVTSDGGAPVSARGVCWSISPNPSTANSHTTDGSGMGTFTSNLTGLTGSTLYYVRAYALNIAGTAYGDNIAFTTTGGNSYSDPFDGTSLDTNFWHILDLTRFHEPGLDLYVNDTLFIVRGPTNDNNGWYGVESNLEYPGFDNSKIDFWLAPEHNWQDHKIGLFTPFGGMGYYNYGHYWWLDMFKSNGDYYFLEFDPNGYIPNHQYSFRISINSCTLKFEWDSGSGFQTVYETTDYSFYRMFGGSTIYKKVSIMNSDRGSLKCDNFELSY